MGTLWSPRCLEMSPNAPRWLHFPRFFKLSLEVIGKHLDFPIISNYFKLSDALTHLFPFFVQELCPASDHHSWAARNWEMGEPDRELWIIWNNWNILKALSNFQNYLDYFKFPWSFQIVQLFAATLPSQLSPLKKCKQFGKWRTRRSIQNCWKFFK